jgi:hypothetical protein
MEVGQGPNWGCSAKGKKLIRLVDLHQDGEVYRRVKQRTEKPSHPSTLLMKFNKSQMEH